MQKCVLFRALALVLCLTFLPAISYATTSENLLVNSSFEDGLTGWVNPDGKWSTVESESGYEPQDGEWFAWPLEANQENTYIYQDVSLAGYAPGNSVIFAVKLCNYDQAPHDMGRVELQFLSSSNNVIERYTQDQRNPNWNQQTIIAQIPSGAAKARVILHAIWYVGGDVDAYYDDASLVVSTEQYSRVYITEKDEKKTAKAGDILNLIADNGVSKDPAAYTWSSSYESAATVSAAGVATFLTDAEDGVAFYAKDNKTGVTGVYWVNSDMETPVQESFAVKDDGDIQSTPVNSDYCTVDEEGNVHLNVTLRDFNAGEETLFENYDVPLNVREGLVQSELGANKKPVFNSDLWFQTWPGSTQAELDALFNDVPGINMTTAKELVLAPGDDGFYTYNSNAYFPIDDELFGNEDREHNYHFSLEAHSKFNYRGTESFEFSGDDDVWVFIDGVLVIDIGGVHTSATGVVSLPELVEQGKLDIRVGDVVDFDFFFMERRTSQSNLNIRTDIDFTYHPISSQWASEELQAAAELGLIPKSLENADLTQSITRAEFAAVAVKVYENLSGIQAIPAVAHPFTDCSDIEVLKAFNAGIAMGTSATTFSPNDLLNREQAATMLTRVFKKITIPGWSFEADGQYSLSYTKPAPFADDAQISDWAKDSVYFMAANGIIKGMGGNLFAPRNTTSAQLAAGYANATREQALIIAVRMVQNLGNQV